MTFRTKLLVIAVLPIILVSFCIAFFSYYQANQLIKAAGSTVEKRLIEAKARSVEHYISLALTSIGSLYIDETGGQERAQEAVKRLLNQMTFGREHHFFVYDKSGEILVHPGRPDLVGKNLWKLANARGEKAVQYLLSDPPIDFSTTNNKEKPIYVRNSQLGYAVHLPKWQWMLGTGLYADEIANEIATVRNEIKENIRNTFQLLFLLTILAVILVACTIYAAGINEQKLADQRLKALTKRIVDVQEEERKRVSTDLHDSISQLLVSVRFTLDLALTKVKDHSQADTLIHKSMSVLENAINEVRRISKDLRPSILDDMGLSAAVNSLAKDFEERSGIRVEVKSVQVGNILSSDTKTALYRVVQEALTNVAKHAEADNIKICFIRQRSTFTMTIQDDGIGFEAAHLKQGNDKEGGIGIRNMHERVESHGGVMHVISNAQSGTFIKIKMPIQSNKAQQKLNSNKIQVHINAAQHNAPVDPVDNMREKNMREKNAPQNSVEETRS